MTNDISVTVLSDNTIITKVIAEPIDATVSKVVLVNSGNTGGTQPYTQSIIQNHLTANKIVIPHGRGSPGGVVSLSVYNNLNQKVQPTDVEIVDTNNCRIDLTGYTPIIGVWRIIVL